jgi:hypothetical protein
VQCVSARYVIVLLRMWIRLSTYIPINPTPSSVFRIRSHFIPINYRSGAVPIQIRIQCLADKNNYSKTKIKIVMTKNYFPLLDSDPDPDSESGSALIPLTLRY